jgi:hypothetical protein
MRTQTLTEGPPHEVAIYKLKRQAQKRASLLLRLLPCRSERFSFCYLSPIVVDTLYSGSPSQLTKATCPDIVCIWHMGGMWRDTRPPTR